MRGRRWKIGLPLALVALILIGCGAWILSAPELANHFGFALPGADGLPYRITYAGRHYATLGICAGADWCRNEQRACVSQQKLTAENNWPLQQVETIPTLFFGASHPVLVYPPPGRLTAVILYIPYGSCYLSYALEGGP